MLEKLYPSPEARGMVLMLCTEKLGVQSYTHIVEPQYQIPQDRLDEIMDDLSRMCKGEPVQYVLGCSDFCGHRFKVDRNVLIPRPETEMLVRETVDAAVGFGEKPRVLDLCTGSGCIAWSVKLEIPQADVYAADKSIPALSVASSQGLGPSPVFFEMDILDTSLDFPHGRFDVIASNPPYIMESEKTLMRSNVLDYEPGLALFVPDSDPLLFYRAIAFWADRLLVPGGCVIAEINESLSSETAALLSGSGLQKVEIIRDFFGKDRFVKARKQGSSQSARPL